MSQQSRVNYPWIVDELVKIKKLEQKASDVFAEGGRPGTAQLRSLVDEMNSRLDILDGVLEFQAINGMTQVLALR